jgi:hypothetical protein
VTQHRGHDAAIMRLRAFADAHPSEVAGMVFLDASDIETSRPEKAAVLREDERAKALAPSTFPPFPPELKLTAAQRAEFEEIRAEAIAD